jgi:hypothetical protein
MLFSPRIGATPGDPMAARYFLSGTFHYWQLSCHAPSFGSILEFSALFPRLE